MVVSSGTGTLTKKKAPAPPPPASTTGYGHSRNPSDPCLGNPKLSQQHVRTPSDPPVVPSKPITFKSNLPGKMIATFAALGRAHFRRPRHMRTPTDLGFGCGKKPFLVPHDLVKGVGDLACSFAEPHDGISLSPCNSPKLLHNRFSLSLGSSLHLESSELHIYEQLPDDVFEDKEDDLVMQKGHKRSHSDLGLVKQKRPIPPPPPTCPPPPNEPWIMLPARMPGMPVVRNCIKSYHINRDGDIENDFSEGKHEVTNFGAACHDKSASDMLFESITPEQCASLSESITRGKVRALTGPLAALFMKPSRRGAELPGRSYSLAGHRNSGAQNMIIIISCLHIP